MHEAQLVNRQRRQDKGIAIWPPEAAVEAVQHIGEGEPCDEYVIKGAKAVAPRGGLQGRLVRPEGLQRQATGHGRFQGISHVQVVRPGFRPILPRVGTGVGANERLCVGLWLMQGAFCCGAHAVGGARFLPAHPRAWFPFQDLPGRCPHRCRCPFCLVWHRACATLVSTHIR
jgi:hypothetical protein